MEDKSFDTASHVIYVEFGIARCARYVEFGTASSVRYVEFGVNGDKGLTCQYNY